MKPHTLTVADRMFNKNDLENCITKALVVSG